MEGFRLIDKVKIDIVSDVVCPWCLIGYKRLEQAISELGVQKQVEIEWQPFELNRDMPEEGEDVQAHILRKYGIDEEGWKVSRANMSKLGEEVGFTFDYFDGMKMPNTLNAHIMNEFAKEHGKQNELNLRLITAHFSEHKNVSQREVLLHEVESLGLDRNAAEKHLDDNTIRQDIKEKMAGWNRKGVNSVPTMVFNGTSSLTGAQPVSVYKQILTEMLKGIK